MSVTRRLYLFTVASQLSQNHSIQVISLIYYKALQAHPRTYFEQFRSKGNEASP